ncbi:MAG: DUF4013 domain-containing protein [Methanobacteriota archaeon]
MGIGENLSDSFGYAQEGLFGKWTRWIILIICTIIFPLLYGYTLRIMKGITPAPEVEGYLDLFIDGIKMIIISFVYMIIPLIIFFASAGAAVVGMMGGSGSVSLPMLGAAAGGLIIFIIVTFIFSLFATIGIVAFARTGSMGEAFDFGGILAVIRRIGWINYILALIVLWIILCVIQGILGMIPVIGWLILLIIAPFLSIVSSRYISNLYDQT